MFLRLLLTALLATTLVCAQGRKGGGGGGGGEGMGGAPMMAQKQNKAEMFADKLKLSREQKEAVQPVLNAAFEQSAPLRDQIGKGRVAIVTAMLEGKTGDDLKKMMDDYTSLSAQMTDLEAKTFAKVCGLLKPNQVSKGGQAFELLVALLEPAGGGMGGPRGGGRGGRGGGRQ